MSTPSPQPLDYDLISPYAPKHVREQPTPALVADSEPASPQKPRPVAIETDHDAQILDDIEDSLRAMIAAHHTNEAPESEAAEEQTSADHADRESSAEAAPRLATDAPQGAKEEAERSSARGLPPARTIDALETPSVAQEPYSPEHRFYETMRVQEVLKQVAQQVALHTAREAAHEPPRVDPEPPQAEPEQRIETEHRIEGYRVPPAFLAPSMEPIQFDEPWPKARPRRRNGSASLLLRFGLAASGAAAVALFALPDMRSRLYNAFSGPLAGLSSNAVAVFGEGKPVLARDEPMTTIAVRTEPIVVAKEQSSPGAPMQKLAAASPALPLPDQRSTARNDNNPPPARIPEAQLQRETVMAPVAVIAPPAVEAPNRSQPVIWQGPPARAAANENSTSGVAARPIAAEELELLRKQGNDFINAGDFAGARGVLERAADAGDAASALALAATYDPAVLARFKVRGLMPDNAKAAHWYERARDLGSQEAPLRLNALARGN